MSKEVKEFEVLGQIITVKDVEARQSIGLINEEIKNIQTVDTVARESIANLEKSTDDRFASVNQELAKKENSLTELVFIGDSFGTGYQPSGSYLANNIAKLIANMLNLNLHNYSSNASGFTVTGDGGLNFNDLATNAISDSSYDHSKVKYVVVLGGINDVNNNPSGDVYNASGQLALKLHNAFPSAEIIFIPNWGSVGLPDTQEIIFANIGAIHDEDNGVGWFRYCSENLLTLIGRIDLMNADNIHPNQAGAYHMAWAICRLIKGSNICVFNKIELIPNDNWNISGLSAYRKSNSVRIFGVAIPNATVTSANNVICALPTTCVFSGTVHKVMPSNIGANSCTVEFTPPIALTSAPTNGKITMFHDHGATILPTGNVLIDVELPILNYL